MLHLLAQIVLLGAEVLILIEMLDNENEIFRLNALEIIHRKLVEINNERIDSQFSAVKTHSKIALFEGGGNGNFFFLEIFLLRIISSLEN